MPIKLRIATFNLENLDDKPGEKPTLDERIALLRPWLLRLSADILCLREVNGQEEPGQPRRLLALEKLLADTPYAGYHKVSTMTEDGTQLYLDNTRVLDIINVRLKSKLPTDIPGQKVDNFTWKNPSGWAEGFFLSSMKRIGQALETRMLVDKLFDVDEDALMVVWGDFNANLDEMPGEALRGDIENTGNDKLAKRVIVPGERTIPDPSRFSLLHHGQGRTIDHLLAS
jgi:hypothetical protein